MSNVFETKFQTRSLSRIQFNQKSKNMLNNFLPPQNKLKQPNIQPKTNKKNLDSSSPNKKTHKNVTPPAMLGSKNPWKPTCLAGCLGSSQGLSLLKRWDWKTKTSGFFWGTPQGIGWWFCRLKKTFKTSPFPGVSPSFFGALPRLFAFFLLGVLGKNMQTISPSELYIYMIWKQTFCKDHFKQLKDSNSKKLNVEWTFKFWETHWILYKSF